MSKVCVFTSIIPERFWSQEVELLMNEGAADYIIRARIGGIIEECCRCLQSDPFLSHKLLILSITIRTHEIILPLGIYIPNSSEKNGNRHLPIHHETMHSLYCARLGLLIVLGLPVWVTAEGF